MKKNDIVLMIVLMVSAAMIVGVMGENIRSAVLMKSSAVKVDVEKVKAQIKQAGLSLYEAKYWRVLD